MRGYHGFSGQHGYHGRHGWHGLMGGGTFFMPFLFVFGALFLIGFIFKSGLWIPLLLIGAFFAWKGGKWSKWGKGWGGDWDAMKAKFREQFGDKEKWEAMKQKWGKRWCNQQPEADDSADTDPEKPKRKAKNDEMELI